MSIFSNLFKKQNVSQKKLICFDGGGVRVIAGLVFLKKLEIETGKKIFDIFDFYSGTSAGAFNAACFAKGISASAVKKYWSKEYTARIMKSSSFWDPASLIQARPRYDSKAKLDVLQEIFGKEKIGSLPKPLLTLSYDLQKRNHVMHSSIFNTDLLLTDVLTASSAAPMYFPSHQMKDGAWFIDGSISTNNPSLLSYSFLNKHNLIENKNIKILSIGAGYNKKAIDGKTSSRWGGVGWLRNDIINILLDSEVDNVLAEDILDESYLRINSDYGKINKLLDDDSDENIEKIHLLGLDWWSKFGDKTIKFLFE